MLLPEALNSLDGRDEFAVKYYDGLVVINYLITLPDTFDGIRNEFRGITFHEKTGEIVSRPFHKFFNIDQKDETQFHKISHYKATVYEKCDGSMIHAYRHPDTKEIKFSTRMSYLTDQAKDAAKFAGLNKNLLKQIEESIDSNFTPIFEYVAPNNQIVVSYKEKRLIYLHSRHKITGEYLFEDKYQDKANQYEIHFKDIFNHLDKEEFEGYVCQLENGMFVKAKGEWYLSRHRAVDMLMRPAYKLYELALKQELDDVIAKAPDNYKPILEKVMKEAGSDYLQELKELEHLHEQLKLKAGDDRKAFAIEAKTNYNGCFPGLMRLFSGRQPQEFIHNRLMDKYKRLYVNRLLTGIDADG